jgi:hypothetical protein
MPFLEKGLHRHRVMVRKAINNAFSARLVARRIRTHLIYLCPAEQKVRLGHQHLIVHVLSRKTVTFGTGNIHSQVACRKFFGLQIRMANVTLAVSTRFFSLRLLCKTNSEHTYKSCKNKYPPRKI